MTTYYSLLFQAPDGEIDEMVFDKEWKLCMAIWAFQECDVHVPMKLAYDDHHCYISADE